MAEKQEKPLGCLQTIGSCIIAPFNVLRWNCCNACGSAIGITNWDDTLGYNTPKFVRIRDRRLGFLHRMMQLLIFIYIVIYTILYSNKHLKVNPVFGTARITVQAPVKDECNPLNGDCVNDYTSLKDLAYCNHGKDALSAAGGLTLPRSLGAEAAEVGEEHALRGRSGNGFHAKERLTHASSRELTNETASSSTAGRRDCLYLDGIAFGTKGHAPGSIFLPTRIDIASQASGCEPKSPDFACQQRWTFKNQDDPWSSHFVADIERFTLLIDHSFQTDDLSRSGVAADHQGYYALPCNHVENLQQCMLSPVYAAVPRKGDTPIKNLSSVAGLPNGDVISVGDLLRIARPQTTNFLDWKRHAEREKTVRDTGAVLALSIHYSNHQPWDFMGEAEIMYEVTATMLPMNEYHQMWSNQNSLGDERRIYKSHGLSVMLSVSGDIRIFSYSHALEILSGALVLLAVAFSIVDALMMYLLPNRKNYYLAKTMLSHDFNEANRKPDTALETCRKSPNHPPASFSSDLQRVLLKFDMRLNRIDGMDANFVDPALTEDGPARAKVMHGMEYQQEPPKE